MRSLSAMIAGAALVGLFATSARAQAEHNDPESAFEDIRSSLITGYEPCLAPNTNTDGTVLPRPACRPADPDLRSDPACGFNLALENRSGGKIEFEAYPSRTEFGEFAADPVHCPPPFTSPCVYMRIDAKLIGLQGCANQWLCPVLVTRATTDACNPRINGGCVIQEGFLSFISGLCCKVTNDVNDGTCKIRKNLFNWRPQFVNSDDDTGLAVYGCGMTRVGTCNAGANNGGPCLNDNDCPGGGAGSCVGGVGTCNGGDNNGKPCLSNANCPGAGASCVGPGTCNGAPNNGLPCLKDADCAPAVCVGKPHPGVTFVCGFKVP